VALGGGVLNSLPGLLPEVYQDMATYLFETRNREPGRSNFLTTSNFFCRRDVLIASGGLDERFGCGAEDRDLVRRLVSAGHRVCADPALVIEHRHVFTLGSYLSHLERQGRGSWLYYHAAGGREREASPLDLLQMLRYVTGRGDRGILRLFLAVCGQAAVACGYAAAMVRGKP
jgi:GT2 family glycosyltransferase